MATVHWNKIVSADGSEIKKIQWDNIENRPPGTYEIVGTSNQIKVDSTTGETVLSLEPTIRVTNIENAQSTSGIDYNTYDIDTSDPNVQYFTRLATVRIASPAPELEFIDLWKFTVDNTVNQDSTYKIKVNTVLHAGTTTSTSSCYIEKDFRITVNSGAITITDGGMNIVGDSELNDITVENIVNNVLTFKGVVANSNLGSPLKATTRVEVLKTIQ